VQKESDEGEVSKVSDGCRLSVLRQRQYADEATANKNKPITLWRPDSPGYK